MKIYWSLAISFKIIRLTCNCSRIARNESILLSDVSCLVSGPVLLWSNQSVFWKKHFKLRSHFKQSVSLVWGDWAGNGFNGKPLWYLEAWLRGFIHPGQSRKEIDILEEFSYTGSITLGGLYNPGQSTMWVDNTLRSSTFSDVQKVPWAASILCPSL